MFDPSVLLSFAPQGMEVFTKVWNALSKKEKEPNPLEVLLITQQKSLEDIKENNINHQKSIDKLQLQYNQISKCVHLYGISILFVLVIGLTILFLTN